MYGTDSPKECRYLPAVYGRHQRRQALQEVPARVSAPRPVAARVVVVLLLLLLVLLVLLLLLSPEGNTVLCRRGPVPTAT